MESQPCPYLGTLDEQNNQQPCTSFPSFENRCFAEINGADSPLMLADQASYCLSGNHALCPRYQSMRYRTHSASHLTLLPSDATADPFTLSPAPMPGLDSDLLGASAVHPANAGAFADDEDDDFTYGESGPRWGVWMAALAMFVLIFVCGVAFSTYAGWQLVRGNGLTALLQPDTALSSAVGEMAITAPTATPASLFVVVTATPVPPPANSNGANPAPRTENGSNAPAAPPTDFNFPQAVTPTPRPANGGEPVAQSAPTQGVIVINPVTQPGAPSQPADNSISDGAAQLPPTPLPNIDVNALVPVPPTRRATPEFEIPTSTPVVETPTETPTPTATWPPPVVIFGPDDEMLLGGECTVVRWEVENVTAVYYENQQALGSGEREECLPDDENDWQIYTLTVVLPSGGTEIYTTTVSVVPPTVTPTPSRTYTPIPIPTETWTPVPPTPTPAPNYVYGTTLTTQSGGAAATCAIGQTCEIGLLATNTGNTTDTIAVVVAQSGPWQPFLCRQDGVCSADGRLELSNVGQSLTAFVTLRLEIPDNATRQTTTYALRALSVESGDSVGSDLLSIQVEAK